MIKLCLILLLLQNSLLLICYDTYICVKYEVCLQICVKDFAFEIHVLQLEKREDSIIYVFWN